MGDERGRNSAKLFALIKSLSKKEKQQFWSFISSSAKRGSDGKYLQLFEEFSKAKTLNPNPAIRKIFGGDQKAYNDAKRYLVQKILECLALNDTGINTEKVIIDKAIEKGFVKHAAGLLRKEIPKAHKQQDVVYLKELMDRRRKLYRLFGEEVQVTDEIPPVEDILVENAALSRGDLLYHRFVKTLAADFEQRAEVKRQHEDEIEDIIQPHFFVGSQVRLLKLRTLWHMLGQDFVGASQTHQVLLRLVLNDPESFPVETTIEELSMGASFLIHEERFQEAEKVLYELGGVESLNEAANRMALISWTRNALVLAACSANMEIGKMALREFERQEKSFPSSTRAFLSHAASVCCIYLEDWEGVMEWQRKLSRLSDGLVLFHQAAPFIRAIAAYEMGMYTDIKPLIQKIQEGNPETGLEYPNHLVQIMQMMAEGTLETSSSKLMIARTLESLLALRQNEREYHQMEVFNVHTWLAAKQSGNSLTTFVKMEKQPGLMKFRMTS